MNIFDLTRFNDRAIENRELKQTNESLRKQLEGYTKAYEALSGDNDALFASNTQLTDSNESLRSRNEKLKLENAKAKIKAGKTPDAGLTLYVPMFHGVDESEVLGVFSTEAKAQEAITSECGGGFHSYYTVHAFEIDVTTLVRW